MSLSKFVKKSALNAFGWRTNKKIVVFESDDWGALRMPSRSVFEELKGYGLNVEKCPYSKFDKLEGKEDLESLFHVLLKYKDNLGRHPVITANTVVANPDFDKIRSSNFDRYYYKSLLDFYNDQDILNGMQNLWKLGIESMIFYPQFHCREHVNVARWLKSLQDGSRETLIGFDHNFYAISNLVTREQRKNFMPSFDYDDLKDFEIVKSSIIDGLSLFEKIFSFKSESTISPAYTWSWRVESVLNDLGVKYLQGNPFQKLPSFEIRKNKKRVYHFTGESNSLKQLYLVRNAYFEPTIMGERGGVDNCLADIKNSFLWKKPAIIGTHRLNFMGGLHESNRDYNLKSLDHLIKCILKIWPEVQFFTTDMLGKEISSSH